MKKVLFYTQSRWAFAQIHYGLCKELYQYGIYCNLLDWTQAYTQDEFDLLIDTYDIIVTNPEAVNHLHDNFKVPYEKIYTIAHAQWDLLLARRDHGVDFYDKLGGFAVVSEVLKQKAADFGIKRIPDVVEFGIHFDVFYNKPSERLEKVGYGGAKETINFFGQEIKRGGLVKSAVAEIPNIQLVEHQFYNWLCMPGYYKKIDALVVSSTEEGAGLPSMESAAAGRLVLSTPVGYFEEHGTYPSKYEEKSGGLILPLEENEFRIELKSLLKYYSDNSEAYKTRCRLIQEYARETYDWKYRIENWVNLFNK